MTQTTQVSSLFDEQVLTAEMEPVLNQSLLFEQEWQTVQRAVPKRQAEFIAGRVCARRLLSTLGYPDFMLLSNQDRSPRWPQSVVGSISHTISYCAVAAVHIGDIVSIGLDVEQDPPLKPELIPRICTPREMLRLKSQPIQEQGKLAKLIFSAKESAYKCQYMISKAFIGFQEAEIELDLNASTFEVSILKDLKPILPDRLFIRGRFVWRRSHVMCGTTLYRSDFQR